MMLDPCPGAMDRAAFIEVYGEIYESSPWVAEAVWPLAKDGRLDRADAMAEAMQQTVDQAPVDTKLALIRAHPELAGRAALAGEMTAASRAEQSAAALDQCSPAELAAFQANNRAYKERFDFPFIVAVKGMTRAKILALFTERLENDPETEFCAAMAEIHKIARFRLDSLVPDQVMSEA